MEKYIDKYSKECRQPHGPFVRLFPEISLIPINTGNPNWSIKGSIGNFQWRSLGAVFPVSDLDNQEKIRYNRYYELCARGGCIPAAFLIMRSLSNDKDLKEIFEDGNEFNVLIANTHDLNPTLGDNPVVKELVLTMQQNMSLSDDDVFKITSSKGMHVSLSIDCKVIKDKIIILPYSYTNTNILRGYVQLADALIQGGAKCVIAVSYVHIMPNKYGQEEAGRVNLPMPRGRGYSFSELADMF